MRKRVISVALIAALGLSIIGCGDGVDQKRLVELTGDKNFAQIKQAWQSSILQEKTGDAKVYAYWLEKNGQKAQPTFDASAFEQSFMMKYNKGIKQTKEKMQEMRKSVSNMIQQAEKDHSSEVNWNLGRALRNEQRMASFSAFASAFVRNTYIPFLKKQLDRIDAANKKLKKEEQERVKKEMIEGK